MLVGHLGAGLLAKAIEPRMKLGTLFAAALFADVILWALVLGDIEHIRVPPDYAVHHVFSFDFPYSHSLLGIFLLSVLFALAWALWGGRRARRHGAYWDGIALILATGLSHWVLDIVVHPADMPVLPGGPGFGFGLWLHQPLALFVELGFSAIAFAAFALRSPSNAGRKLLVGAVLAVIGGLTLEGAYGSAAAPESTIISLSSLGVIVASVLAAAWADRSR